MIVDLRSDTVTRPTLGMLEAMFKARAGDDVYGEDETVNELERKASVMFNMEAAVFCPSGTMTNQIAINCLTAPMDEVITDQTAHVYRYEAGGMAFNSGVSVRLLEGDRGRITAEQIEENLNPDDIHHPRSSLVVLENTVNRGGGSYYRVKDIEPVYHLCRLKNLKLHLDGARLFNALVETGDSPKDYGRMFDSISICLSKGLGAPVGSLLLGSREMIQEARRLRKVFGGGWRQAGYLAAAGIYALDHHIERLKEDHQHARILENALNELPYTAAVLPVDTNILIFELDERFTPQAFIERLNHYNVKCNTFGRRLIRMVTHLDITPEMIDYTIEALKKIKG